MQVRGGSTYLSIVQVHGPGLTERTRDMPFPVTLEHAPHWLRCLPTPRREIQRWSAGCDALHSAKHRANTPQLSRASTKDAGAREAMPWEKTPPPPKKKKKKKKKKKNSNEVNVEASGLPDEIGAIIHIDEEL